MVTLGPSIYNQIIVEVMRWNTILRCESTLSRGAFAVLS